MQHFDLYSNLSAVISVRKLIWNVSKHQTRSNGHILENLQRCRYLQEEICSSKLVSGGMLSTESAHHDIILTCIYWFSHLNIEYEHLILNMNTSFLLESMICTHEMSMSFCYRVILWLPVLLQKQFNDCHFLGWSKHQRIIKHLLFNAATVHWF